MQAAGSSPGHQAGSETVKPMLEPLDETTTYLPCAQQVPVAPTKELLRQVLSLSLPPDVGVPVCKSPSHEPAKLLHAVLWAGPTHDTSQQGSSWPAAAPDKLSGRGSTAPLPAHVPVARAGTGSGM